MPRVQVVDSVELTTTRRTKTGYLVADAKFARVGVQTYRGSDLNRPDLDSVVVYRPETAVFDEAAMASFAHKPITDDHPPEDVTSENWKTYSVGYSGDQIVRDGGFVKIPMMITDAATIKAYEGGKKQLSAGYSAEITFEDGVTPEGEPYQAKMGNIVGNHIAIVQQGRAGSECRIGDSHHQAFHTTTKEVAPMADRTVIVDSVSYTMSDQAAEVVSRLQRQIADTAGKVDAKDGEIAALKQTHTATVASKDGEIAALKDTHAKALETKDGEIAALKSSIPVGDQLDAAIEARTAVIAVAKAVIGDSFDAKGKTDADIRKEVVTKRLGDAAVAGKLPQYFDAAFDVLTVADSANTKPDPLRALVMDGAPKPLSTPATKVSDADDAYEQMLNRTRNAYKSKDAA